MDVLKNLAKRFAGMVGIDQSGKTERVEDEDESDEKKKGRESDEEILKEARSRFSSAEEADADDRDRAKRELVFAWNINDAQWDDEAKKLRDGRPMLSENRFPSFIRQVINEIRQSRPAGRVLPVDDQGDKFTASVIEGNIRNIEANSRADMAYDCAAEFAAYCGRGYWKITTEYVENTFDQDLVIRPKRDPFTIYDDPNCQMPDKSDRKFAFEAEWVDNDEFEAEWGEPPTEYTEAQTLLGESVGSWFEDKKTLVCKYWRVKCEKEKIYLMSDGVIVRDTAKYLEEWFAQRILEREIAMAEAAMPQPMPQPMPPPPQMPPPQGVQGQEQPGMAPPMPSPQPQQMMPPPPPQEPPPLPEPPTVVKEREQDKRSVESFVLTGAKVYRTDRWAGKFIPLVYCGGEQITVDNKLHTKGLTEDAHGLAKANNYALSVQMEKIALSPRIPYIGPKGAFNTDNDKWTNANTMSYPYIEYDGAVAPQRNDAITVNPELQAVKGGVVDGMRAVVGLMGASLGDKGPETAWRAIQARKSEGDTAVFHFMDNLVRAVRYSCMVLVDAMPHYYDSARMIRIINPDNQPMTVAINQTFTPPGATDPVKVDFAKGKYDVTVSAGPAFETQRQQTAATLVDLSNRNPQLFGVAGDIIVKALAMPQADEIAERLKKSMPPNILGQGPSPQEQQLQQQMQGLQQQLEQANTAVLGLQSELAKQQANLERGKVDHETSVKKLEAQIATGQADVEKATLEVQRKEAELAIVQAKNATVGLEESQKIAAERLMLEVEKMLAKHADTVETMCKAMMESEPGEGAAHENLVSDPLEDAAKGEAKDAALQMIAQSQQQLHEAIAALTEATLRPRESRVTTPDGREFRSLSTAVQSNPNITQ